MLRTGRQDIWGICDGVVQKARAPGSLVLRVRSRDRTSAIWSKKGRVEKRSMKMKNTGTPNLLGLLLFGILNTWSPVSVTVQEELVSWCGLRGNVAILEEVCHWEWF